MTLIARRERAAVRRGAREGTPTLRLLITDSYDILHFAPRPIMAVIQPIDEATAVKIMSDRPTPQKFFDEKRGRAVARHLGLRYKIQPALTPETDMPPLHGIDGLLIVRLTPSQGSADSPGVEYHYVYLARSAAD